MMTLNLNSLLLEEIDNNNVPAKELEYIRKSPFVGALKTSGPNNMFRHTQYTTI